VIRVVLADDQSVVRAGFRVILELAGDIEVVGECADGPTAVRLARRLEPDVVCMDVRMPGGDGLAATREITSGDPHGSAPAVLVVTTFDLDEYVFGALEAGASGFVLKDTEPDDLVDAVRRLARGHGLVDQAVTRRVIAEFARRRPAHPSVEVSHQLTARETDIVRLLAQGMSNAEIARELVIETSTVKSHLGRAMTKIGVRDRLQTVVWAYQNGMAGSTGPRD
jgi:DNA-binding NarL/FixJ family response regulator